MTDCEEAARRRPLSTTENASGRRVNALGGILRDFTNGQGHLLRLWKFFANKKGENFKSGKETGKRAAMTGFSAYFDGLPLADTDIEIGGRTWTIRAVESEDALLRAGVDYERFPFGLLLWESAVGLARHLAAYPAKIKGRRVLELGAGAGLAGLAAQWLGASVWQTDHQPDALALAQINATHNGMGKMKHFLADWRHWTHTPRYPVILGADILYQRDMRPFLAEVFTAALEPGGTLLLSDPGRPQALEFIAELEASGWKFKIETETVLLPGKGRENRPVEVAIYTGGRNLSTK